MAYSRKLMRANKSMGRALKLWKEHFKCGYAKVKVKKLKNGREVVQGIEYLQTSARPPANW